MRSTREHAREHGNDDGTALLAQVRRRHENGPNITGIHCLLHLTNLGMGETILSYELDLEATFIPFLQGIASYFSRSGKRKESFRKFGAALKALAQELARAFGGTTMSALEPEPEDDGIDNILDDNLQSDAPIFGSASEWGLLDIKGYCPTRWLGMFVALKSINNGWGVLQAMKDDLIARGFGPPSRAPPKSQGYGRDHAAGKHTSQTIDQVKHCEACAAAYVNPVTKQVEPRSVIGTMTTTDLMPLDDPTGTGDANAAQGKRDKLLDPMIGITDLNRGRVAYMFDFFKPYARLMKCLQTTGQPIQPLVCGLFRDLKQDLSASFLPKGDAPPKYPQHFRTWIIGVTAVGVEKAKPQLVAKLKEQATQLATIFLKNLKSRLSAYWSILCAFELVDPTLDEERVEKSLGDDSIWTAMEAMVVNCNTKLQGTTKINFELLRDQLVRWHQQRFDTHQKTAIRLNLLRYFHEVGRLAKYSEVYKFAAQVFTRPIASVIIESLFSKMAYIRGKYRATTEDQNVFNCIAVKDLDPVYAHPEKKLEMPTPDLKKALKHDLTWNMLR